VQGYGLLYAGMASLQTQIAWMACGIGLPSLPQMSPHAFTCCLFGMIELNDSWTVRLTHVWDMLQP
jgi:hypothetical protein